MYRTVARWLLRRYVAEAVRDLQKKYGEESDIHRGIRDALIEGRQCMMPRSRTARAAETLAEYYVPRLKQFDGDYAAGYQQGFRLLLQEINGYEPPAWLDLFS